MEQEQFKQEVLPLRKQLLFYAQRFLANPEEAEDVIQEVLLKLWEIREKLAGYENIPALALQITKHLCLNRLKLYARREEDLDNVFIGSDLPTPYAQLEQKDSVAHVMKIIDHLPNLQQTILRMKHIDGLEVDEIASITGSNPEAVRMNLSRARKKVKEMFFKIQT
jgi:RNA polymerase sigma-70 factor (ECF subfamily)